MNGSTPFLNSRTCVALLRRQHGAPDDDREPRQLGRLEADRPELDPAPGAVDRRRDRVGEGQHRDEEQHDGDQQQRPGQRAPAGSSPGARRAAGARRRSARPISWRSANSDPDALAPQRDQARRAIRGGDPEHEQESRSPPPSRRVSHRSSPGMPHRPARSHRLHRGPEALAPLLVVLEHVVAGAGRRQQHRVARLREPARGGDHLVEGAGRAPPAAPSPGPAPRAAPDSP